MITFNVLHVAQLVLLAFIVLFCLHTCKALHSVIIQYSCHVTKALIYIIMPVLLAYA